MKKLMQYKIEGWMFYPFPDMKGNPLFSYTTYTSKRFNIQGKLIRILGFILYVVKL